MVGHGHASRGMQVLVVSSPEQALPEGTTDLVRSIGWDLTSTATYREAVQAAGTGLFDAVIMTAPDRSGAPDAHEDDFQTLLRAMDTQRIAGVMVGDHRGSTLRGAESLIDTVDREVTLPELRGRLAMIERYHTVLKRLEHELSNMQRLGKRLNRHFQEVDQEMRLAGRLQRDFLPDVRAPIENVQFAAVYQPASWVSGDIFDVFRVDEEHIAFYLADAVGHGMAAGLLTMFIKRAVVPKRVETGGYAILSPSEVVAGVNVALTEQALPNCHFVTLFYGLLNRRTLALQYARGGHPYPVLITKDGIVSDLKSPGGLLGIFSDEEYSTFEIQLHRGDKVLLYTDGLEPLFQSADAESVDTRGHHRAFGSLAKLPIQNMMMQIESRLDRESSALEPRDDVTVVGLEILDE